MFHATNSRKKSYIRTSFFYFFRSEREKKYARYICVTRKRGFFCVQSNLISVRSQSICNV